jgi:DNA gyrase/topoisomerase IV subunit A
MMRRRELPEIVDIRDESLESGTSIIIKLADRTDPERSLARMRSMLTVRRQVELRVLEPGTADGLAVRASPREVLRTFVVARAAKCGSADALARELDDLARTAL